MDNPRQFTPKTQEALTRILEATRKAMAEVQDNMRILEEGRERTERRIENLKKKLDQTRQALEKATQIGAELEKKLETRTVECARANADLETMRVKADALHSDLENVSVERDALAHKTKDFDALVNDKLGLQCQLAEAADVAVAQEKVIADLERQLREALAETEGVRHTLDTETARAAALHSELADATRAFDTERAAQTLVLEERNAALAKTEQELENAHGSLRNLAADIEALKRQLQSAEDVSRERETQLGKSAEAHRSLADELAALKRSAEEQTRTRNQRIGELEAHMAQLAEENTVLAAELSEAQDAINGFNAQLASEVELRKALEVDLDVARKAIEELRQELAEVQEETVRVVLAPADTAHKGR